MRANPNGFSLAYNAGGEVHAFKTLSQAAFMRKYKAVKAICAASDTAMLLHMRIATHGSVKPQNCHCWTADILGTEMAFGHNGILSIPARGDMTDSETFLRDYLEHCQSVGELIETIQDHIGSSKFAFLDGDGNTFDFGPFIVDRHGVRYSNRSFIGYDTRCADPRLWGSRAI